MKKILILWTICFLLSSFGWTEVGDVLKTIQTPGPCPTGLAWDGSHLWVADSYEDKIFEIEPATGKVIKSFDSPGYNPEGLAWDGKALWHVDSGEKYMYKIDPETGTATAVLESNSSYPRDLAWDGEPGARTPVPYGRDGEGMPDRFREVSGSCGSWENNLSRFGQLVSIRLYPLRDITLGTGHVMSGFASNLDVDHYVLGAVGQLIMKIVGQDLAESGFSLGAGLWLFVVFCLYGGVMGLFTQGLKHGRELSTTYPVYSLTFVWAAIIGFVYLGERLAFEQLVGIAVICMGVALINMPPLFKKRDPTGT